MSREEEGVCSGCGAPLQTVDPGAPGYVPAHVLEERASPICQRCYRLVHYRALQPGAPAAEQVRRALDALVRQSDAVIWVADVTDFEGSAHPSLLAPWAASTGRGDKLWVAVNKVDLLPSQVPPEEVRAWAIHRLQAGGVNPRDVVPVSAARGYGVEALWQRLLAPGTGDNRPRIGLAGVTNAGKSTLLRALIRARQGAEAEPEPPVLPTASPFPGTTQGIIRLKLAGGVELLDSPGVLTAGGRLSDFLCEQCASLLVGSESLKGALFPMKEGQALHWAGLAAFTVTGAGNEKEAIVLAYAPPAATPIRTGADRLEARLLGRGGRTQVPGVKGLCGACQARLREIPWEEREVQIPDGFDLAVAGLGWLSVRRGPVRGRLYVPAAVWHAVRPNLVGIKALPRPPRPSPRRKATPAPRAKRRFGGF